MSKIIALLAAIFLIFPYAAYSATTFAIQETEKISLQANATDPDADRLAITLLFQKSILLHLKAVNEPLLIF